MEFASTWQSYSVNQMRIWTLMTPSLGFQPTFAP